MAKFKLPNRKWYTLQQAADKLSREAGEPVTVDDLLHYASIGVLDLCVEVTYFENLTLQINKNNIELKQEIKNNVNDSEGFLSYSGDYLNYRIKNNTVNHMFGLFSIYFTCLEGLYINYFNGEYLDVSCISLSIPRALDICGKHILCIGIELEENIKINEFYILDKELELLKKGGESINRNYNFYLKNKIKEQIKEPSEPVKQRQIDFIRALLLAHYDTIEPEEVRSLVNNGKLGRLCLKKGISIPTGETVRNWLKI